MKCLIVANSFKDDAENLSAEISSFLTEKNVQNSVFLYDGRKEFLRRVDFSGCDFVVTLGGDGTVLFACRGCAPLGIPVFPVNLGEFGFLATVAKNFWRTELDDYLSGKSFVSERCLVRCEVVRGGETVFTDWGMNDCVISSCPSSHIVNLQVAYNHALLGPFKTNGIIVSTPTGSTAYSGTDDSVPGADSREFLQPFGASACLRKKRRNRHNGNGKQGRRFAFVRRSDRFSAERRRRSDSGYS
jgi:NAD+ kinase